MAFISGELCENTAAQFHGRQREQSEKTDPRGFSARLSAFMATWQFQLMFHSGGLPDGLRARKKGSL